MHFHRRSLIAALAFGGATLLASSAASAQTCPKEPVPGAENELFKDMPPGSVGHDEAILLYNAGITSGCNATPLLFCPGCNITRAQMMVMLVNAAGIPLVSPGSPTFSDVPKTAPYYAAVETAFAAGITSGCAAGKFCPNDPVPRANAATLIVRASGLPVSTTSSPSFSDVPTSSPHFANIETLKENCVTQGCGNGAYCPADPLKRAGAAVFVARAFNIDMINECLSGGAASSSASSASSSASSASSSASSGTGASAGPGATTGPGPDPNTSAEGATSGDSAASTGSSVDPAGGAGGAGGGSFGDVATDEGCSCRVTGTKTSGGGLAAAALLLGAALRRRRRAS